MSAEQIVAELCDELGVEPDELVDRVFSYHLVNMAFDACVRQRVAVAELESVGDELADAAHWALIVGDPTDLQRLNRLHHKWRAVRGAIAGGERGEGSE